MKNYIDDSSDYLPQKRYKKKQLRNTEHVDDRNKKRRTKRKGKAYRGAAAKRSMKRNGWIK